jgi:hypothetical protein
MAFYKLKEWQIRFKLNRAAKTCPAHDHFSISSALTYATKRPLARNIRGPEVQLDADAMKQQLARSVYDFPGKPSPAKSATHPMHPATPLLVALVPLRDVDFLQ